MRGALKLSGIVRANLRLNIAIPMLSLSLKIDVLVHRHPCNTLETAERIRRQIKGK